MKTEDSNDTVYVILLDFSKAFDRVNHTLHLNELASTHIAPPLLNWFRD